MNWLLLRGLGREQRHWGGFPEILRAAVGGEVRCIDAPGFGTECTRRSPSTIGAITDDIRGRFGAPAGEWSIVGISLGGMVALDWCARYPGDFRRAVVINTSSGQSLPHRRFRFESLPVLAGSRLGDPVAAERAILGVACNSASVDREALAREWAAYAAEFGASRGSIAAQMLAALRFRHPRTVSVPLLVLASRADRLVSYRCSRRIATALGAPLRLHETAGHDLPLDDPTWIAERIVEWMPSRESR
ncbi:alpha/beta fold hydrolase [Nocardia sp. NPDC050406]|uniref:alpha/beta fold hydrolase n=1 Tax=Nocardia sp. NPDC050406 TaxID=3364318 RepID=UPI0037963642